MKPTQLIKQVKKGCGKNFISPLPEDKQDKCGDILDGKVNLCQNYKAKIKTLVLAFKNELKFLEGFDWGISIDACKEARRKGVWFRKGGEHFEFIIEDQTYKLKQINKRITDLKKAIKLGEGI